MKKFWLTISFTIFFFCLGTSTAQALNYPKLANYYLGEIQDNQSFLAGLSKYDLVILTPEQIDAHRESVKSLRRLNPNLIVLAYVPTQSYNIKYWDKPWSVFRHLRPIADSWWLKDASGNQIIYWSDLAHTNMDPGWSRHLVAFINQYIKSSEVDGIFFDMVSDSISWLNGGNVDMNNDRIKDTPAEADKLWLERTEYFLDYAQDNLNFKYLVINGSSNPRLQSFVNGRMLENFPKPWDNYGEWGKIMNGWKSNTTKNTKPLLTIINTNTANSGKQYDYRKVRYGLSSALLLDGYFSFDYGDTNHGQVWWYDEYDANLGNPTGEAKSISGATTFKADVWRRDFENGVAIVNSTGEAKNVDLGGDFEKLKGKQDPAVNDGAIVSNISVGPYDGQIMLKTISTLENVLFRNGDFVRFFNELGERTRNGFFVFDANYNGGDQVAKIDINGNEQKDIIVASQGKLQVWRDDGQIMLNVYPFGANYKGELKLAIGDLNGDNKKEIAVGTSSGYKLPIKIYFYDGSLMRENWLPLGKTFNGGYSLAIGKDSQNNGRIVLGTGKGYQPKVSVYNDKFGLIKTWLAFDKSFKGGVNVAAGNVDGLAGDEIVVGAGKGGRSIIKIYNFSGKLLYPEFKAISTISNQGAEVLVADINFDGKAEIIVQTSGF